uniref:Uncharacterized protein n=1 Tax=Tanacetum cinerariifolium TaxID=118510 RepID=A0A6L2LNS4_TANCI|nr:hypothetical protein [Tanacetum cinerariifolium]
MPQVTVGDTTRTKSYIPKVSAIPGFVLVLAQFYKPIENRCIHEGRVVDQLYYKSNGIERMFTNIPFNCLFKINEPIEELIRENVFGLGGNRDHLSACLAHMLYCIVAEEQYNLAYFFGKRIECALSNPTANLRHGMFLTHLYRHIMEHYPHLDNGIYNVVDRVMCPLTLKQLENPEVIVANLVTPSHQNPPIITVDLHLTKEMMMRMMVFLVLVPHLLPLT